MWKKILQPAWGPNEKIAHKKRVETKPTKSTHYKIPLDSAKKTTANKSSSRAHLRSSPARPEPAPVELKKNSCNSINTMPRQTANPKTGLTHKQEKFAQAIAKGLTQQAAYEQAYDCANCKVGTVRRRAGELIRNPLVAKRIDDLLATARVIDLDSIGRAWRRTLDGFIEAQSAGNHSAAKGYNQQLLKLMGMLQDRLVVTVETFSDAELLDRLGRGDPKRLEAARALLDVPSSFSQSVIDVPESDVKVMPDASENG